MGDNGPEIEKALMSGMRNAVEAGYRQSKRTIREITKTVSLSDDWNDVLPEEALSWLDRYVPELARVYENAVLEEVREVISRSLREGVTNSLTATELGRVNRQLSRFARSRLECISRTEAMRAYSMGSLRSAIDSEAVVGFEFSAVLDSRTSEICHAREGMRFRINDPRLAHNTPPLHPNCRSVLLPLTAEEFPDGIEEDTRIDRLPDSTQRPIDIEAVRSVLSFNGKMTGMKNIDIVIDSLTSCLLFRATGKKVETEFSPATPSNLKALKKKGWKFNWEKELGEGREVIQLTLEGEYEIQGLVSLEPQPSGGCVYVHLAESAPHNIGKNGKMEGVGAHLFAIAAQLSEEKGFEGFVAFESKTNLIDHYRDKLGAKQLGNSTRMFIDESSARKLIDTYMHGRRVQDD